MRLARYHSLFKEEKGGQKMRVSLIDVIRENQCFSGSDHGPKAWEWQWRAVSWVILNDWQGCDQWLWGLCLVGPDIYWVLDSLKRILIWLEDKG